MNILHWCGRASNENQKQRNDCMAKVHFLILEQRRTGYEADADNIIRGD
jgi:hypothetical protein